MQNTIRVTATGSSLQVLTPAPSVSQWHRSLSLVPSLKAPPSKLGLS